jgi:hypothetical protein
MLKTIHHIRLNKKGIFNAYAGVHYPVMCIFFCLFFIQGYGQHHKDFEELDILMIVPKAGEAQIPSYIKNEEIYLSVKDVFDFLKINNQLSVNNTIISGFFINSKNTYKLDKSNRRLEYQDKSYDLDSTDLLQTNMGIYLKSDYFCRVFELDCKFNFRGMFIMLHTKLELPVIREKQLDLVRSNLSKLKNELKADTIIRRSFSLLQLGNADWSISNFSGIDKRQNVYMNLNLGAVVAGGEFNANLFLKGGQQFIGRQQNYRWKYVNNNLSVFRQISLGTINMQSISTLLNRVYGVQVSNAATNNRRSFGSYRINNKTEPGWLVELYVNNILVNFVNADASGFYTFDVPLLYGDSEIKLRFYGPMGEEFVKEQNIRIPFSFLPKGQFEYSFSAGIIDNLQQDKIYRAQFNYGLNRKMTIGGGMEYLSSAHSGKGLPFVNLSWQMNSRLMLTGEHVPGVRTKGVLNYRLPSNVHFDMNYTNYHPEQKAVRVFFVQEKKAALSVPFRGKKISGYSRLSYSEYSQLKHSNSRAELLVSANWGKVNTNLTTFVTYNNPSFRTLYSNLFMSFRLPKGFKFNPQLMYNHNDGSFNQMRAEVEKRVGRVLQTNLSYQKSKSKNSGLINIGIRLNLNFIQTSVNVQQQNESYILNQTSRGSLIYGGKGHYLNVNNQSNIGRGGLVIVGFLDLNNNGRRDQGEPKLSGLHPQVKGGRMQYISRDTSIRINGLEAYTDCQIDFGRSSFENISWQLRKKVYGVTIEPNKYTLIEVPVSVLGEAAGTVFLDEGLGKKGLGRMRVNFFREDSVLVGRVITESDGYFSFLGLTPGIYYACVDTEQLQNLQLFSTPRLTFEIKASREGDFVEGLNFVLRSAKNSVSLRK